MRLHDLTVHLQPCSLDVNMAVVLLFDAPVELGLELMVGDPHFVTLGVDFTHPEPLVAEHGSASRFRRANERSGIFSASDTDTAYWWLLSALGISVNLPTAKNSATIYRLSGALNPLHIESDVAHAPGFEKLIFYGLATYGVVGRALFTACSSRRNKQDRSLH
jgi:hypothetical protein